MVQFVLIFLLMVFLAAPAQALTLKTIPTSDPALNAVGVFEREYLVENDKGFCKVGQKPFLLIALHGGGLSAEFLAIHKGFHLANKCSVVAYPNGTTVSAVTLSGLKIDAHGGRWAGYVNVDGAQSNPSEWAGIDDLGFLRAVIAGLKVQYGPFSATYATGISNGASMAYRLACSGDLDGVAAASGDFAPSLCGAAETRRDTHLLLMNGLQDECMPWDGGVGTCPGALVLRDRTPVPAMLDYWLRVNGLWGTIKTDLDDSRALQQHYAGAGKRVEWCAFKLLHHDWSATARDAVMAFASGKHPTC